MGMPFDLNLSPMTGMELLALRRQLGLRQEDLAAIAGYSRQGTISECERGKRPVPQMLAVILRLLIERRNRASA